MSLLNLFKKPNNNLIKLDQIYIDKINKQEFYTNYFQKRIPVLIKNGAKDWDLIKKWNKDYIRDNMSNYICKVVTDSRPAYAKQQTTIKNYFNKFTNANTLTLDKYNKNKPPLFFKDLKVPNILFGKNNILRFFFYHAQNNAGTLPHIHGDAFNVLQQGEKYWMFYDASPKFSPKGYEVLKKSNNTYSIGTHAKDWFKKELPKLSKTLDKVYHCTQEVGDIIYIPSEYAHAVLNKSEVMGIVVETLRK